VGKGTRRQETTRKTKMDLGEIWWGGVDWIGLALNRDKWRAFMNAVINLLVP
jgi:hypothetical protein